MTETINGLHSCKPGNEPIVGQIKTFTVEQKTGKTGKAYLKIKAASTEKGGQPYRILSAEPTGYTDDYGNHSFNIEIEKTLGGATGEKTHNPVQAASVAPSQNSEDGVKLTREHLMRSANLYNLCVDAADKAIAPWMPEVARTSEQFQAIVASLYIEASRRITIDGVNWWSYLDKMPITPIKKSKANDLPF